MQQTENGPKASTPTDEGAHASLCTWDKIKSCLKATIGVQKNAGVVLFVFFLYKTGEALLEPSIKLYLYEETCLTLITSDRTVCKKLSDNPQLEQLTQQHASSYIMWYRVLLNVPAILLSLFSGAWSDKFGRKLPMMLPCVGGMLCVFLYLLSMIRKFPFVPLVLIGATVNGLCGKSTLITMACHSYITDISSAEMRTNLLGKLLSMNFLGIFFGSFLIGILMDVSDYVGSFLAVVFINGVALMVIALMLPETIVQESCGMSEKVLLCKCEHVQNSFTVATRQRPGWKRCYLWLFFIAIFIHQACKVGEVDVTLLFVKRRPLQWSTWQYGYYLSFDYAVLGLTLFFVLPFFSNVLQVSDVNLLILSIVTKIARLAFIAAASQTWLVYVSSLIGCFGGILVSASKSMITKIIEEFEVGKMFSLLSCAETASNMIGSIAFTALYQATVDVYAGTAFLADAIVYGVALTVTLWYRRHSKLRELEELYSEEQPLRNNPFRNGTSRNFEYDTNNHFESETSGTMAEVLQSPRHSHIVDPIEDSRKLNPFKTLPQPQPEDFIAK